MKFGSVCSGIEAASVAFEPLGWKAAWFSEIEPFPCAVLKHHYPDTPNHGDMTTLPERIRSGEVEAPDLFCGGTPCQAFSVAGLRQSLSDDRGNLSLTFCEIANAIDDVRLARGEPPAIIFWENVPGVLSTQDNAFGCFLGALSGCDTPISPGRLGWTDAGVVAGPQRTVSWRVLDAQYFGLAQRRRRVFVVASAREGFDPSEVLLEWQGVRRDFAPSREAGKGVAAGTAAGAALSGPVGTLGCNTGPRGHGFGDFLNNQAVDAGHLMAFGGNRTNGPIDVAPAPNACGTASGRQDFETEAFITTTRGVFDVTSSSDPAHSPRARANAAHRDDADTYIAHTLRGEGFDASEDGTGRGTPLVPMAFAETAPTLSVGHHGAAGHPHRQIGNETAIVGMAVAFHPTQDPISSQDVCHAIGTGNRQGCATAAVAFGFDGDVMKDGLMETMTTREGAISDTAHAVMQPIAWDEELNASVDQAGTLLRGGQGGRHDGVAVQPIPIDSMNHIGRGDKHSFGDFQPGAPSYTLTKGHSHAVAVAPSLTASNDPSRSPQSSEVTQQVAAVHQATMQVRRLTPVECERLQGFPDGYTAIPWRGKPTEECPDGPRYKALGNSWAVPCVRWIGRRIQQEVQGKVPS